tara:strand:- start:4603 stop:4797 length:195 start_codon:yes stop_codon:yes gene_type:complete
MREGFTSKHEKATAIYDWFKSNPEGNYSDYRTDMESKSNIVEYEDVKSLFKNRDFTVATVLPMV